MDQPEQTNLELLAVPATHVPRASTTTPSIRPRAFMRLLALLVVAAALVAFAAAHEHHGEAPTCAGGGGRVVAEFRPGEVTLDGHPADWEAVEASEFALLPALDPDDDKAYTGGKVAVKVPPLCPALLSLYIAPLTGICGSRETRRIVKI